MCIRDRAWGEGSPISYPSFREKYGVRGSVITAVDLLRGIAIGTGMGVISVEGATGNKNTNFAGKGEAAIRALREGADFVYIHVEAPDELSLIHIWSGIGRTQEDSFVSSHGYQNIS